MNLFNLFAKITLDDKDYKKGIKSAEKSGKSFGSSLAKGLKVAGKAMAALYTGTVAVASAIAKMTLSAVNYGDEIAKESQKLNMSMEGYQKWSTMLEMAGTSIDIMSMGMKTFTGILDEASKGNATALLTLQKLGLGYEDFAGLSVEDSLKKVVEQFQTMEQGAEKTQLAVDLFGRSGQELLPLLNQEVGSIDELFKSYEDLGLIISEDAVKASEEMGNQLTLLKKSFKVASVAIGTAFMPTLNSVVTGLLEMASGAASGAEQFKTGIISALKAVIDYLPKIGEFAAMIIPLIVDTVVSTLPQLLQAAIDIVVTLADMLIEYLPELLQAAIDIVVTLADMLIEYLPELIPAAIGMILTLIMGLVEALPMLIDTAIDLILAIVEGLINALPLIIEAAPKILIALINGIVDALPKLIDAAIDIIMMLADMITDPEILTMLIAASFEIMKAIAGGLISSIGEILKIVPKLFTALRDKFKNTDWKGIGKNIIEGIGDGIKNAVGGVVETAKNAAKSIFDGVKGFFGINSPSRLFRDEVGKYIPQGIAVGVENEMPETADRVKKSIKDNTDVDDMVNGFNTVSRMRANNSQPIQLTVPVYIGNEELKTYTYKAVDSGMKQRGLRDLKTTGGYNT
jgi:phage-related protein